MENGIISLCSAGLQQQLNICSGYSELHDPTFNAKSQCVCISAPVILSTADVL